MLLFGNNDFNEIRYYKTGSRCQLDRDPETLPGGDWQKRVLAVLYQPILVSGSPGKFPCRRLGTLGLV